MKKALSTFASLVGLLMLPMVVSAGSAWHQGNGDVVTFTPEHIQSQRTREEASAAVAAAQQNGTLRFHQMGIPMPAKSSVQPKTRAQVVEEMRNQSPESLKAQKELFGG